VTGADLAAKVSEVSTILEIEHLLDRRPRQLSGGQRQRVALARAIVRDPAAFLMDEPLSNLDARLRLSMRGELKRLCHRLGATTLYVTHDQAEALTMADLIAVMNAGELQQVGSPEEIYERPANRFVATFVGNPPMNVVKAVLTDDGLRVGGVSVPLKPERRAACAAGELTEMGMRPEDLSLVDLETPGALKGEVYVVEPMGNETLVEVRVGSEHLSVRAGRGFTARVGAKVGVKFDADDACFFDAKGATVVHRVDNRRVQQ
jgi:multiple sugar transport system ATP-binding protein